MVRVANLSRKRVKRPARKDKRKGIEENKVLNCRMLAMIISLLVELITCDGSGDNANVT